MERLVRKFDFEMVAGFVPKKHQKLMQHIRKTNDRLRRKRNDARHAGGGKKQRGSGGRLQPTPRYEENGVHYMGLCGGGEHYMESCFLCSYKELLESSDDDGDGDDEVLRGRQKGVADKKSKAWIKEGSTEDDPVNFMDPTAVKSIFGSASVLSVDL